MVHWELGHESGRRAHETPFAQVVEMHMGHHTLSIAAIQWSWKGWGPVIYTMSISF